MDEVNTTVRTRTFLFTDLVDSTALKSQLGDQRVAELIARHPNDRARIGNEDKSR